MAVPGEVDGSRCEDGEEQKGDDEADSGVVAGGERVHGTASLKVAERFGIGGGVHGLRDLASGGAQRGVSKCTGGEEAGRIG